MKKSIPVLVLASLLLVACSAFPSYGIPAQDMGPSFLNRGDGTFSSNGERIYFTAANSRGEYIPYTGGPAYGGMMMSSTLTCASCHGSDGRGGVRYMHMDQVDAPDIRYSALLNDHDEDEDELHPDEYSLDTFRNAVVLGQHPDGDSLDRDMPRWDMNDEDLADLLDFLKTLP